MAKFEIGDKVRVKRTTVGEYPSYLRGRDCTITEVYDTQQTETQQLGGPLSWNVGTPSIYYTVKIVPRYSSEDAEHESILEEDLEVIF